MNWPWILALPIGVALASCLLTRIALRWLQSRAILDVPNERSSHTAPVPRGGGIGLLTALLPAWLIAASLSSEHGLALAVLAPGALALALLSWIDDRRSLSPLWRLLVQAIVVAIGIAALSGRGPVFQGLLPPWLDPWVAGFLWLWFVNLYNFMDGIDGITGVETVSLGVGLALLAFIGVGLDPLPPLLIAAAALGFLVWNWHPARIFLGDVGSVPLGFFLGGLLIAAAEAGAWEAALILPLYYLADATYTLLRRAWQGERVWQAHRQHFYQRAVQGGWSHARVSAYVLGLNVALVLLALLAGAGHPLAALALAALATLMLLIRLGNVGGGAVL